MPQINPTTKVAELLANWPELEPVLIAQAPAFQKLRSPVLRRTIARVATLEQAAGIAGLPVRDLIITLRRAAGQPVDDAGIPHGAAGAPVEARAAAQPLCHAGGPASSQPSQPSARLIDADAMLETGAVPIKPVFDAAATLQPGEVLTIRVSFEPVPLLEKLRAQGYRCEVGTAADGRVQVSVTRDA